MLAFVRLSELSTLDELFESVRLLVWFVVMLAFTRFNARSTLDELFEREKLDV